MFSKHMKVCCDECRETIFIRKRPESLECECPNCGGFTHVPQAGWFSLRRRSTRIASRFAAVLLALALTGGVVAVLLTFGPGWPRWIADLYQDEDELPLEKVKLAPPEPPVPDPPSADRPVPVESSFE